MASVPFPAAPTARPSGAPNSSRSLGDTHCPRLTGPGPAWSNKVASGKWVSLISWCSPCSVFSLEESDAGERRLPIRAASPDSYIPPRVRGTRSRPSPALTWAGGKLRLQAGPAPPGRRTFHLLHAPQGVLQGRQRAGFPLGLLVRGEVDLQLLECPDQLLVRVGFGGLLTAAEAKEEAVRRLRPVRFLRQAQDTWVRGAPRGTPASRR